MARTDHGPALNDKVSHSSECLRLLSNVEIRRARWRFLVNLAVDDAKSSSINVIQNWTAIGVSKRFSLADALDVNRLNSVSCHQAKVVLAAAGKRLMLGRH
jgi:hypothetical protein